VDKLRLRIGRGKIMDMDKPWKWNERGRNVDVENLCPWLNRARGKNVEMESSWNCLDSLDNAWRLAG
jgi:hypothetical protein